MNATIDMESVFDKWLKANVPCHDSRKVTHVSRTVTIQFAKWYGEQILESAFKVIDK